jgi:hypothetical protein
MYPRQACPGHSHQACHEYLHKAFPKSTEVEKNMAETSYDALLKLPMGKKEATIVINEHGEGTPEGNFEGSFTVLDSTAPFVNGKISEDGTYSAQCTITTIMGTTDVEAEWKIIDGKIDGSVKNRMGRSPLKAPDLW